MNRSGSHTDRENRKIFISTVLIRRGGAPSGAAAFIVFGGMEVISPISNSRRGQFSWEIIFHCDDYPPCASPAPVGGGGACDASELPVQEISLIYVYR
jgi:hypothetical protein